MIEAQVLADRLQECAELVRKQGPDTWTRVADWETAKMPAPVERDDDDQAERRKAGRSAEDEEDRRGDAVASRYRAELAALTKRLDADMARVARIIDVCNPPRPDQLMRHDMLLAQVAAEGYCVSCWRDDQTLVEVAKGRYRDRCRHCGEFRAAEGQDPPQSLLVKAHERGWRSITSVDVDRAMGRA